MKKLRKMLMIKMVWSDTRWFSKTSTQKLGSLYERERTQNKHQRKKKEGTMISRTYPEKEIPECKAHDGSKQELMNLFIGERKKERK